MTPLKDRLCESLTRTTVEHLVKFETGLLAKNRFYVYEWQSADILQILIDLIQTCAAACAFRINRLPLCFGAIFRGFFLRNEENDFPEISPSSHTSGIRLSSLRGGDKNAHVE